MAKGTRTIVPPRGTAYTTPPPPLLSPCSPPDAVASASYDGTVVLWDRVTGMPLQQLLTHSDHVNGVALSARWQLVTGAEDGRMLLWNRRTCALVRTFFALPASVDCLALTGNDLVAGASDGTFVHFSFEPEAGLSF